MRNRIPKTRISFKGTNAPKILRRTHPQGNDRPAVGTRGLVFTRPFQGEDRNSRGRVNNGRYENHGLVCGRGGAGQVAARADGCFAIHTARGGAV